MLDQSRKTAFSGFSLLELSIVLVIIALLAGGVMVGQDLVRQSELRAVLSEYTKITTALQAFRGKYNAIPGDFSNATAYWGKNNAACSTDTGTATANGTCNGNNNRILSNAAAASGTGEIFQFWEQLSLAGLMEGSYSGLAGSGSVRHAIPGTNIPDSKLSAASWSVEYNGTGDNTAMFNLGQDFNFLILGTQSASTQAFGPIISPAEASSIDTKMDDGQPAYGRIIARYWNNLCSEALDGTPANNDFQARYRVSDVSNQCALYFKL